MVAQLLLSHSYRKNKKERKRLVPEKIHNKDAENGLIRFRSIVQLRNISHSLKWAKLLVLKTFLILNNILNRLRLTSYCKVDGKTEMLNVI